MSEADDTDILFVEDLEAELGELRTNFLNSYIDKHILFWISLAFSSKPFLPSFIMEIQAEAIKTPDRLPESPGVP